MTARHRFVLGLFLATFLFALLVLTRMDQSAGDVPSFAVIAAVVLAVISMGAIIHFIHHVATRIQADVLIGELARSLDYAVAARVKSTGAGTEERDIAKPGEVEALEAALASDDAEPVAIKASGYLNRRRSLDGRMCEETRSHHAPRGAARGFRARGHPHTDRPQ